MSAEHGPPNEPRKLTVASGARAVLEFRGSPTSRSGVGELWSLHQSAMNGEAQTSLLVASRRSAAIGRNTTQGMT